MIVFMRVSHTVYILASMLASWLFVTEHLSRAATNDILKFIGLVISLLVRHSQSSPPPPSHENLPPTTIPSRSQHESSTVPIDVRTAIKFLDIEPSINRSVVCPNCFTAYKISDIPERCTYRETRRSRSCNTELLMKRATRREFKWVPRCLYSTQEPESWLESFLMRPGTEDSLDASYDHVPNPNMMESVWDSAAWQSLRPFTCMPGNLTFSFYIDWFNPGLNKIAGKKVSCGAIMMFCLNLPYELQHLPKKPTLSASPHHQRNLQ